MAAHPLEVRKKREAWQDERIAPADFRARFELLLLTWPEQTVDRLVADEGLWSLQGKAFDRKLLALEEQHGVGHYAARKELLDVILNYLSGRDGVFLGLVWVALRKAKGDLLDSRYAGRTRELRNRYERFKKDLPRLKALIHELDALYGGVSQNFYRAHWSHDSGYYAAMLDSLRDAGNAKAAGRPVRLDAGPLILPDLESPSIIRRFREFLETDPLVNQPITGPTKRPSPGRPERNLKPTRQALKAFGVIHRDDQSDLLQAVGLNTFVPH